MIINHYITKIFLKKLLNCILICIFASFVIDGIGGISSCAGTCNIQTVILTSLYSSILFTDDGFFFIFTISSIWFTITLSRTNQYLITSLYFQTNSKFIKNVLITSSILSVFYVMVFSSVLRPSMKNYIEENKLHAMIAMEKIWINAITINDDVASGNVYFIKNVESYLDGYTADSISVYEISKGYLTSYKKYKKPFLTSSIDGYLMFIFRNEDGKTTRSVVKDVSINDIRREFKVKSNQHDIGFFEAAFIVFNKSGYNYSYKTEAKIIIIRTIEKVIGFFTGLMIVFSEFPMYHQRTGGNNKYKLLKVVSFSMICYTIPGILKIVNNYGTSGCIASLMCSIAILCIFFSRLVKHHH